MTNLEIAYLVLEIIKESNEGDLSLTQDRNGSVAIEFVVEFMNNRKEEREYTEDHIQLISNIFSLMAE